jgi:hypothetical protein
MSKDIKLLRGQVRQVVKEMMDSEFSDHLKRELSKQINDRLDAIVKNIQETLKGMDDRAKDIQDYIVRASLNPAAPTSPPITVEEVIQAAAANVPIADYINGETKDAK